MCGGILPKGEQVSIQNYLYCRASQSSIDLDSLPEWLKILEETRKYNIRLVNFLREIMSWGLLRASPKLRDKAIELLDEDNKPDICPDCEGSGELAGDYFSDEGMMICQRCGGRGII
jgi:hypothetical protein